MRSESLENKSKLLSPKIFKEKISHHPLLSEVVKIHPSFVEIHDLEDAPTDHESFLNWWWETKAVNCQKCLLSDGRQLVVKPDGLAYNPRFPKVMIVGEGPGFLENFSGIPLVGPTELKSSRCGKCLNVKTCYSHRIIKTLGERFKASKTIKCSPNITEGQILSEKFYLQSAGTILDGIIFNTWKYLFPRQNWIDYYNRTHPKKPLAVVSPWFITNIVLCRSFDKATGKDKSPPLVAKNTCKLHLAYQKAAAKPAIMVILGKQAKEAILGEKYEIMTNNIVVHPKWGPVIYQDHPAHVMRENNVKVKSLGYAKLKKTLELALRYAGYKI